MDRWCDRQAMDRGAVLSLSQTWELAKLWYGDRMDPNWRRRTPAEAMAAFALIGLTGDFWKLA